MTSERLPDKEGFYLVKFKKKDNYADYFYYKDLTSEEYMKGFIDWWLEKIPNREEELIDLLQDAINYLDDTKWEDNQFETFANFIMNTQNIVWEIKNNAPKLLDDE